MTQIEDAIISIIQNILPENKKKNISNDMAIVDEIGLDSMSIIRLYVELEENTGVSVVDILDYADITTIVTIKDLAELIKAIMLKGDNK